MTPPLHSLCAVWPVSAHLVTPPPYIPNYRRLLALTTHPRPVPEPESGAQQPGNKLLSCTAAYRSCWTCFWRMGGPPVYKHDRLRWSRNVKLYIWMIWSIVSFVWNTVLLITKVWSSEMAGCGCWCSCLCSRPAPLRPSIVADPFVMPIQTPAPPGSLCQCTN